MGKVSIICPLYNKKNFISQTIQSVLQQSSDYWELIVVDDGSTDGSYELVYEMSLNEPRIKLLRRSDFNRELRGANICRNIGVQRSTGNYVFFLDADDLLMPYCVEQRISYVSKNPGYNLYVFNVAYCKGKDAVPYAKQFPQRATIEAYNKAKDKRVHFLRLFLKFDLPWHTSGPLWEHSFFCSCGGFNPDFQRLQDPEIHSRILMDENVRLKYAMGETNYDILHRNDEERTVWTQQEFLRKRLEAITQYINTFVPMVIEKYPNSFVKQMQGYLIEAEKISYRYLRGNRDNENSKEVKSLLASVYRGKNTLFLIDWKFKALRAICSIFSNKLLIKMKFLGLFLALYKKLI